MTARITTALAARRRAVHAACRQLAMDEDTRRGMLATVTGQRSTKDLDLAQCEAVLEHLRKLGAKRPAKARAAAPVGHHPGYPQRVRPETGDMISKIEAQLADMRLPWAYLTGATPGRDCMLKRLAGVDDIRWAKADGLRAVIAALHTEQGKRHAAQTLTREHIPYERWLEILHRHARVTYQHQADGVNWRPDYDAGRTPEDAWQRHWR